MMMKNRINRFYMLSVLVILLSACDKEGAFPTEIKTKKSLTTSGFSLVPLDQYFDGVKIKELYASVDGSSIIGFSGKEVNMELRKQSDGKILYQQQFDSSNATNEVPRFYFDGNQLLPRYEYPDPVGNAYTANFYFDFPKGSEAVDITVVAAEYTWDWNLDDPFVPLDTVVIPLLTNIKPGQWSEYYTIPALALPAKSTPESDFSIMICIKKAGKDEYYWGKNPGENLINLDFPNHYTTEGRVQSWFVGYKPLGSRVSFEPKTDLVRMFPK